MIARRYLISGRVQGVGFRYFTLRQAEALGVRGWVRNLPGGAVEVHAEGTDEAVLELQRRVETGPAFGSVSKVKHETAEAEAFTTFEILT